jgi:tetratricopeptide (TPR) repeat protein
MKKLFCTITILVGMMTTAFAADLSGKTAYQGETFNFELAGQKNWDYDLKRIKDKNQTKIVLSVKAEDAAALEQIKNTENPFVKSIQVKTGSDGQTLIEFALKEGDVETFDYLTDQPSKLIVDFYQSDTVDSELKPAEKPATPENKKPASSSKKVAKNSKAKAGRQPADVDILRIDQPGGIETSVIAKSGLYDGGDPQFSRFLMRENEYSEEAVIRAQNNYYLKFPLLESEFSFWKKMQEAPPLYEIKPQNDDENKQARLIKTLFDKRRFLVFKKTAEWFEEKYPHSKYLESIAFMTGDAMLEMYKDEHNDAFYMQAQAAYKEALEKYPESALAERTSLMIGMLSVEKLDYMAAIRSLSSHIENKNYEDKISTQYAKIALAYSFSRLNRLDDALKALDQLEKQSKDPLVLATAAVYRGDFYFQAKKYDQAIKAYEQSIKNHPIVSSVFPSAYFNKMEAQFWTKNYRGSHQSALDFTKIFPAHPFAPYALTRLGELLEIMGADQSKSVGAFLETHFRYGDDAKTIVARLHLLSTRMKSMKGDELAETLKKMDSLAEKSELQNIDQFKTAMLADGFSRRQEYPRAIEILSEFFQQNPNRPDSKQVTQRIVRNVNDELKFLADKQEYLNLLKTYKNYADSWLKGQNRIDTDYLLGLAYENAGAYGVAIDKFKKTSDRLSKLTGSPQEKEVRVNEYLPTNDGLNLKLASDLYENKEFQSAYQALEKIKNPLQLPEDEQVQRILLASKLYEQKGDSETAVRYLSELARLWKGSTDLVLPVYARLAEMQVKRNSVSDAIGNYQKCVDIMLKQEKPDERLLKQVDRAYLDLLVKQDKNDDAISMLSRLVEKFEPRQKMSEEKYQLGYLYFKKGELKKAEQAWANIPDAQGDIWKKLANEKLQQANWDESYKKHIKRIPAMSQMEGQ